MKRGTKEKVTLGSGKLYIKEYTGTLPEEWADILSDIMQEK